MKEIIKQTFSKSKKLPSNNDIKKKIDGYCAERSDYVKYSFPIISHEFLLFIKNMIQDLKIKEIAELNAGCGWLTFWMRKYNIPVKAAIDDKSWLTFEYLEHITEQDSIQFVVENPEIELFILSWPYMDNVATEIWYSMNKGQYLLYIGEDKGGCTANDEFFDATKKYKVKDKWGLRKNFINFPGIHDYPKLFRR